MGFLEDLGRSGAANVVGQVGELALGLARERRLAAESSQRQAINALQLRELMQRQKAMNRIINIKLDPTFMSLSEPIQQKVLKMYQEAGVVDQEGRGPAGDILQYTQLWTQNKELFKGIVMDEIREREKRLAEEFGKLKDLQLKGAPQDKINKQQAVIEKMRADIMGMSGRLQDYLTQLDQQRATMEALKYKRDTDLMVERLRQQGKEFDPEEFARNLAIKWAGAGAPPTEAVEEAKKAVDIYLGKETTKNPPPLGEFLSGDVLRTADEMYRRTFEEDKTRERKPIKGKVKKPVKKSKHASLSDEELESEIRKYKRLKTVAAAKKLRELLFERRRRKEGRVIDFNELPD